MQRLTSTRTWLFSTTWELQLPPKGHKKDINGFIQVLQVPLDAPQVVPELISGPVDFFSCGDGGILQELCPPLEEPLGSVHSLLHLPVQEESEQKPGIIISCPAAETPGQPRVQLGRDASASSQTSFPPTTSCLFCKIRICPVPCCSMESLMERPISSGEAAECHPGKPGRGSDQGSPLAIHALHSSRNTFPLKALNCPWKTPQGHTELQELSPYHSQADC